MNARELNETIVQLIGKLIDRPLSSGEIKYAPKTYRFVIEELERNFLHVDNKTLESMLIVNTKILMVICFEIIQTTGLEKKVKEIISSHTLVRQEVVPGLQTGGAYKAKAFELAKAMVNTINKLLDLPISRKIEDLYTPEIHEPKIEELKRDLEQIKKKERDLIANGAFMLLLICDVILNTLQENVLTWWTS